MSTALTEPRGTRAATLTTLIARIEAATPADRDRAVDGLRALAILGVVVGHWLVMALTSSGARSGGGAGGGVEDGSLHVTSPLIAMPEFAPVSWVLQLLGVFFLVGGYASTLSWQRAQARGLPFGWWLRGRMARLLRPVAVVVLALSAALPLLAMAGVPAGTLRTAVVLVAQPLWFVGVYAVITALTPVAIGLHRRLGIAAALLPLLVVTVVDVLRYGPPAQAMPTLGGWVGWLAILPGWAFGYVLGVCWAHSGVGRWRAGALALGGALLGALLVLRFGYPASVVGVPGVARNNSHPPSLLVLALAATQCGLVILLRDRLAALLRRPGLWAVVVLLNLSAMTIFCWHQVALVSLSAGALAVGSEGPQGLPGLHDAPDDIGWVLARLAWLPVYAVVLTGWVALARRFENPRSASARRHRVSPGAAVPR